MYARFISIDGTPTPAALQAIKTPVGGQPCPRVSHPVRESQPNVLRVWMFAQILESPGRSDSSRWTPFSRGSEQATGGLLAVDRAEPRAAAASGARQNGGDRSERSRSTCRAWRRARLAWGSARLPACRHRYRSDGRHRPRRWPEVTMARPESAGSNSSGSEISRVPGRSLLPSRCTRPVSPVRCATSALAGSGAQANVRFWHRQPPRRAPVSSKVRSAPGRNMMGSDASSRHHLDAELAQAGGHEACSRDHTLGADEVRDVGGEVEQPSASRHGCR